MIQSIALIIRDRRFDKSSFLFRKSGGHITVQEFKITWQTACVNLVCIKKYMSTISSIFF